MLSIYKRIFRDFPGGPAVETSPSNTGGAGMIPCQRAKIPPCLVAQKAKQHKTNHKTKQHGNRFNKDLKNGPHQKNFLKLKKKKNV